MEDRLQWALQQIIGDESLTGDLEDNEAQRLLDWGIGHVRRLVQQTSALDDAGAQAQLEPQLQALRRVIRRINKLVGSISSAAPDEIDQRLQEILESAEQSLALSVERPADTSTVAKQIGELAPAEALRRVMSFFKERAEAAPPEAEAPAALDARSALRPGQQKLKPAAPPAASPPSTAASEKPYVPPDIPRTRPGAPPERPPAAAEPASEEPVPPPALPKLRPGAPPERPPAAAEPPPPPKELAPPPDLPKLRPGAPTLRSGALPAKDEDAIEPPDEGSAARE